MLLRSDMVMKYMGLKLGPALKLCHHIERLKQGKQWSTRTETSPPHWHAATEGADGKPPCAAQRTGSSLHKHTHLDVHLQPEHTLRNISAALWERPANGSQGAFGWVLPPAISSPQRCKTLYRPISSPIVVVFESDALPPCDVILVHRCFWNHLQPLNTCFLVAFRLCIQFQIMFRNPKGKVWPIVIIYSPNPYDFVFSVEHKKRRFVECSRCSFSCNSATFGEIIFDQTDLKLLVLFGWRFDLRVFTSKSSMFSLQHQNNTKSILWTSLTHIDLSKSHQNNKKKH